MRTDQQTDCIVCIKLAGFAQCNHCRATRPNRQTLTRRAILDLMRQGFTPDEAHARMGARTVAL